jgi:glutamate racemase
MCKYFCTTETIANYLEQNMDFFAKQDVKAVVVACNTASTAVVEGRSKKRPFPVYDVIGPGSKAALSASQSLRIGVIGTRATVMSSCYEKTIRSLNEKALVYSQACPLLVPLVEEGWENDPLTNLVLYRYIHPLMQNSIDTLVLGCTHYPVLREAIARVTGPYVNLVDSAQAVAEQIRSDKKFKPAKPADLSGSRFKIFVTDRSPMFLEVAARLIGPLPDVEMIDLSRS